MGIQKAVIKYQTSENDKSLEGKIEVMFNPANYSVSRTVNYSNINNTTTNNNKDNNTSQNNVQQYNNYPTMNFLGGNADTLNLELFINKYEFKHFSKLEKFNSSDLDIINDVKELEALTLIKGNLHRPPLCEFNWSSFKFRGYVTSFQANYTMFLDDGTPVRAKVSLTIHGADLDNDVKVPYESPDRTKHKLIQENQQLWEIAQEEYDDPSKWREIAKANGINNPLYIKRGTRLIVPAIKK